MQILILILFSLSKKENYMFLSSLYQQRIFKIYQKFLVKDLRGQFFGMNIKQKVSIITLQMNIDVF